MALQQKQKFIVCPDVTEDFMFVASSDLILGFHLGDICTHDGTAECIRPTLMVMSRRGEYLCSQYRANALHKHKVC